MFDNPHSLTQVFLAVSAVMLAFEIVNISAEDAQKDQTNKTPDENDAQDDQANHLSSNFLLNMGQASELAMWAGDL